MTSIRSTREIGSEDIVIFIGVSLCLSELCLLSGQNGGQSNMALRQATGFVESLLQLIGLDWRVPDFSTLCRRQKTLVVDIASRRASEPLHLLIDSTGIKVEGEGEWHARKHGVSSRRVWRKIHLAIDKRTLEVCAVEVTSSNVGDAPMLPELLGQISQEQEIGSVTADGAYDTRKCHDAIAGR
jgi:hypothetical protein